MSTRKRTPILYRKLTTRHNFIMRVETFDSLLRDKWHGVSTKWGILILRCKGSRKDTHFKYLNWFFAKNRILRRHRWQGKYIREWRAIMKNKKLKFNQRETWHHSCNQYACYEGKKI